MQGSRFTRWSRTLGSVTFLSLAMGGCQLVPNQELLATQQSIAASQTEIQQQLVELSSQLNKGKSAQERQIKKLQTQVQELQQESQRLNLANNLQFERLSRLLDPSFNNQTTTEVVQEDGKLLLGHQEWVALPLQNLVLPARVDSGANTSSLHAMDLQEFERDGKKWVRFKTLYQADEDSAIQQSIIEAPLVRYTKVQQASGAENRALIKLPLQLGSLNQEVEFTLTDRSNLIYPVLLGRRFFMDIAVIDVSKEFVQGKPSINAAVSNPADSGSESSNSDKPNSEDSSLEEPKQ